MSLVYQSLITIALIIVLNPLNVLAQDSQEEKIEKAKEDILKIGIAIETLFKEKGVMLVDLDDGTTGKGLSRIRTTFEGAGMPENGVRTMRDVYQPLVHFGYLEEIPTDPFIPDDAPPEWDTYIYVDHEAGLSGYYDVPFLSQTMHSNREDNEWYIFSAGPNLEIEERLVRLQDIQQERFSIYMVPPFSEKVEQRQQEVFQKVGQAIEAFRQDHNTLLLDFWDDDHASYQTRVLNDFNGVGQPAPLRTMKQVLEPLVAFGYLDEVPFDPVAMPYPRKVTFSNEGQLLYIDNDPQIDRSDYGGVVLNPEDELEEGEWLLVGYKPDPENASSIKNVPNAIRLPEESNLFKQENLNANLNTWSLHQ